MNVTAKTKKLTRQTDDNIGDQTDTSKTPKRLQVAPETEEDFKFQPIDTTDKSIETFTKSKEMSFNTRGSNTRGLDMLYDRSNVFTYRPSIDWAKQFESESNTTSQFNFNINGNNDPLEVLGFGSKTGQAYGTYELTDIKNAPATIEKKVEETEMIKNNISRSKEYAEKFVAERLGKKGVEPRNDLHDDDKDMPPLIGDGHRIAFTRKGTPFESPQMLVPGESVERIQNFAKELEDTTGRSLQDMRLTPVYDDASKCLVGIGKRNKIPVQSAFTTPVKKTTDVVNVTPDSSSPPKTVAVGINTPANQLPAVTHLTKKDVQALEKTVKSQIEENNESGEYYNNVRRLLTEDKPLENVQKNYEDNIKMMKTEIEKKQADTEKVRVVRDYYNLYRTKVGLAALKQGITYKAAMVEFDKMTSKIEMAFAHSQKEPAKKRKTPTPPLSARASPVTPPTSARSSPVTPSSARSSPVALTAVGLSTPVNPKRLVNELRSITKDNKK